MGNNTQIFLLLSLIVPICFKIFFSIGVLFDLVWDLFNMLQIVANIRNITVSKRPINGLLVIPSCLIVLLEAINNTVYFKPLENELIKDQLRHLH